MKSSEKFSSELRESDEQTATAREALELCLQAIVPNHHAPLKSRPRPRILVVEETDAGDEPVCHFYTLH